jgi:hypothetical protein
LLAQLLARRLAVAQVAGNLDALLGLLAAGIEQPGLLEEPNGGVELVLLQGPLGLGQQIGTGELVLLEGEGQGAVGPGQGRAILLLAPLLDRVSVTKVGRISRE